VEFGAEYPSLLSIANTAPESVVPDDHGIAQTEPNLTFLNPRGTRPGHPGTG
jgi:hypothetical protein